MGQKVNPVIIRQSIPNLKSNTSIWFSKKNTYRNLLFQNFEITNFINLLFQTWGIFIRNCLIFRNNNLLCLNLDLYFNYRLAKERLLLERKNFFFCFQKTIPIINQPKVMKEFIFDLTYFKSIKLKTFTPYKKKSYIFKNKIFKNFFNKKTLKILFLTKTKKNIYILHYYEKYLFIFFSEYIKLYPTKKDIFPYIVKRSNLTKLRKIFLLKLQAPVYIKKFNLNFFIFYLKNTHSRSFTKFNPNFLSLHHSLCKSLHNYTGIENIKLKFYSTQLLFMPSLRLYLRFFLKELFFFKRNKALSAYFYNVIEIVYFVLSTYGIGNAKLLAYHISHLLENTRKHLDVVKFLKKVIDLYFMKIPKLLVINGIRVLITGRFNKRQRSKSVLIQKGEICLHTFTKSIDYYQTQAVTFCGSFGIKIWFAK
uniref:Ribosomal protein S3 n=1 Tax=Vischeria stellata TaxID=1104407 RepID=A0A481XGU5_9STRA|nr:ribosomal protein S3 [Vischeria stellata]QBK36861.1 ribosomal protein S3 [Vischeria stellata]